MTHVLVETLLLENIADCVVEIWRKLSLGLFGVCKRFTPGVVDLIVPAAAEALANLGLQAMIVRPTGTADVVRHESVRISRQEEPGADRR
jgi:hypothetical protein